MTDSIHEKFIGEQQLDLEEERATTVRVKAEFTVDVTNGQCWWWVRRLEGQLGEMTASWGTLRRPLSSFDKQVDDLRDSVHLLLRDHTGPF